MILSHSSFLFSKFEAMKLYMFTFSYRIRFEYYYTSARAPHIVVVGVASSSTSKLENVTELSKDEHSETNNEDDTSSNSDMILKINFYFILFYFH